MRREEEQKIIERIKKGETSLYESLVNQHSPKIIAVIRGVVGNNEEAEELAQDVFVKAFFSLDKFRGDSSFATWLFRIAYNLAISQTRKKRLSFVEIDKIASTSFLSDNQEESEAFEREKRYILLTRMLNEINPEDRFLLLLFYYQEKSIKEIAEITGKGESNIKVTLHRIKKRLAAMAETKMEVSYG